MSAREKARELARKVRDVGIDYLAYLRMEEDEAVSLIQTALESYRAEALEEAAKIAEQTEGSLDVATSCECGAKNSKTIRFLMAGAGKAIRLRAKSSTGERP